ncbi:MAG: HAD family hydrolase [Lachnospiraceae bacterium]
MKYKYLFFDLDGTLTDPGIGITNSIMYALEKYNIHVKERSVLYPFIGPPLVESFMKYYGFDEDTAVQAVKYYREYFGVKGLLENEVYEGMHDLLEWCVKKGYHLALATSKPEHFAVEIMKHFRLDPYFDHMCGSHPDACLETKADVIRDAMKRCNVEHPNEVLMIGDRMHDIEGARECNMECAAVLWGYGDKEEFIEHGASYIVESMNELKELLEK